MAPENRIFPSCLPRAMVVMRWACSRQTSHRLEAIAERLGVSVFGRHTALGDAMVTGEVFLKMLPLLAEMGITTLRQAREASQRTYHARLKY